jgi:hypothetical protein
VGRTIKAVVTPKLYVLLLLGLPFLTVNHIVADFELRTAIDKLSNYDLLNPPSRKQNKRLENAKATVANTKRAKKLVLTELVEVCKRRLSEGKGVPEVIKPLDVVGMIKNHIKTLSWQQKMGDMEAGLLKEFYDVFEPLPHVDKMPTNVKTRTKP